MELVTTNRHSQFSFRAALLDRQRREANRLRLAKIRELENSLPSSFKRILKEFGNLVINLAGKGGVGHTGEYVFVPRVTFEQTLQTFQELEGLEAEYKVLHSSTGRVEIVIS